MMQQTSTDQDPGTGCRGALGECRQSMVLHTVINAVARSLGWEPERIVSLSGIPPRDLVAASLNGAGETPGKRVRPDPVSWRRAMAAAALRSGQVHRGARIYEESLELVLPRPGTLRHAHLRRTAPAPIGSPPPTGHDMDLGPAQIRKLVANGDYRDGVALFTEHFTATGDVTSLAGVHAALNEIEVSVSVLKHAADRLDWPKENLHSLRRCRVEISAKETRSWLGWLSGSLPILAGSASEPVEALLVCAQTRLREGVDAISVAAALPRSAAARWRARLIEAEAALAAGNTRCANWLLTQVSQNAPHVTAAHRRLGCIAYGEGRGLDAAHYFEAAMLSPNTAARMADQADTAPVRITSLRKGCDVSCYRGRTLLVPRDTDIIGVTIMAGRPFLVRDTPGYRQARRIIRSKPYQMLRGLLVAQSWRPGFIIESLRRSDTGLARLLRAVARRVPAGVRARLLPMLPQASHATLGHHKRAAPAPAGSPRWAIEQIIALGKITVLRFCIGAERLHYICGPDHVGAVFREIRHRARQQ